MPEQWAVLLQNSNITKFEQQQHPQAVLDALNYYTQGNKAQKQKFLQIKPGSFGFSPSPRPSYQQPSPSPSYYPPQYPPPPPPQGDSDDELPPPIPDRPPRTMSIYTKAREEDERPVLNGYQPELT